MPNTPFFSENHLAKLSPLIEEALHIPFAGNPPPFPLDLLVKGLQEALSWEKLDITIDKMEWKKTPLAMRGIGKEPHITPFELSPLKGTALWGIDRESIPRLCGWLSNSPKGTRPFSLYPAWQEGLYTSFLLEVFYAFEQLPVWGELHPHMLGEEAPLEDSVFTLDISIRQDRERIKGRLILSKELMKSFEKHFTMSFSSLLEQGNIPLTSPLALSTRVGSTHLTLGEWQNIAKGDFLVLEECLYSPTEDKGSFHISLQGKPLFHSRLKEEGLKILDYIFETQGLQMDNDAIDNPSMELDPPALPHDELPDGIETQTTVKEDPTAAKKLLNSTEIPLEVTVEAGHFQISLGEFLQLKPGNVLPLKPSPKEGVVLTINQKTVAKGELVQMGDVIGVKITKIAKD